MPTNECPHIILVLANLMAADGTLNPETASRVRLGCALFMEQGADRIMFIGWDYRPDSDIAICDAMNRFRQTQSPIADDAVLLNPYSRDTVGDAILSRIQISRLYREFRLTVVTTDYHAARTREIFKTVYGAQHPVEVVGAESMTDDAVKAHERKSLDAFHKTFAGVPAGDIAAFRARLVQSHPFYNGQSFPDRPLPQQALGDTAQRL